MSRPALILMATRNGARHLPAQLASFAAQRHCDWRLMAQDDGSEDATPALLEGFAAAHPGRVGVAPGPKRGSAANFLSLIEAAARRGLPDGGLMALSDQDDVWLGGRMARAGRVIAAAQDGGRPVIYAARTIHVDAALRPLERSRLPPRGPSFGNALVQNVLAGNTLACDAAGLDLLGRGAGAALAAGVAHHDWWIYLLATGAGARIVIDPRPVLLYRQHGGNVLGAHRGLAGAAARAGMLARRGYAGWVDANLAALEGCAELLTPQARRLVEGFRAARRDPAALAGLGVRRQTAGGDLVLRLLARSGRL